MDRVCDWCGKVAVGHAGIWTKVKGSRYYCHGEGQHPSCYELAQASLWHDPTVLTWAVE